ncbi:MULTISPECIES: ExeM/NucH family extracellular endonuclease [unclassified Arsukibacterium]|uniref:ExeM/NucH family extracellular endonuclease n=1 Tax=unclassified Arsukibacterium TaxID=2635278 RepID=UPI0025BC9524|nr:MULTISPECIES: ExeM/NucH family extracellular endonuclease [unclassified Arsukibacterium]
MMRIIISLLMLLVLLPAWAQQPIAYWSQNFNTLPSGGNGFTPTSFPQAADVGAGDLFLQNFDQTLDGNGAYSTVQAFAGSTVNALSGFAAGQTLSVQGGTGNSNNGAEIIIQVDTTDYQDIMLSWAQRGTSTGFTSRQISWSVDGVNYQFFAEDSGALGSAFQSRLYDFSALTELNNQAQVYFKITLDGASSASGNNRFDNLLVQGTAAADVGRLTVYDRNFTSNPFDAGWTEVSVNGTESWDWNGSFGNVSFAPFIDGACRVNDSWLISPAFNLNAQTGERLAFDIARGFAGTNPLEVYYSSSYNGSGDINPADWLLLTTITSDDFTTNNVPVRFDGFEQLADATGQAYIAFRYNFDSGNCSTWRLANIEITAEGNNNLAEFACGNPVNRIHTIQGAGFQSPVQGAYVQVEAVVTASFQDTSNGGLAGFYLQELNVNADMDPQTSEGIFVYDNGFGVSLTPGDLVRVGGTVAEYFEETQLTDVTDVAICATFQLGGVTPQSLNLPVSSFARFESTEGMWLNTGADYTVSDVFNAARFGEYTVSNGRLFTPTQVVSPGEQVAALMAANLRNKIIIDNGRTGIYQLPFIAGADGVSELSASNPLRNGYLLNAGFSGIMGYSFGAYRLRSLQAGEFSTGANPRLDQPATPAGNLRLATYNVENLFNTLQTADNVCGPNALECRGAATLSEQNRQLAKITETLLALNADVVALIEIENDADDATLALLTSALNELDVNADWAYIATGFLGTDAIKPAFIYRSSRVTPQGAFAVLDSSVDPDFDTSRQRPALAQTFVAANMSKFTAVAVHLRAKASCPASSDPNADQGDGQGCWNLWRTLSANALANWLATDPTASGDEDYLILGDFNAYAMEDPLTALIAQGYQNLAIAANDGDPAVYSYTFMGEAGSLDHAFASPAMQAQVLTAAAWHINADEVREFNYSEAPLRAGLQKPASFYNADPFRSSDHDPLVVELNLTPAFPPVMINLELIRVNRGRSGATLVQLRWNSDVSQALTLYRDENPVATLSRPGRYNDQFKNPEINSATYRLCLDATAQCSEPLVVNF